MLMFFAGSKLSCRRCGMSHLFFPECIFSRCPGSFCSFPFSFHSLPFTFPLPPTFPRLCLSPVCLCPSLEGGSRQCLGAADVLCPGLWQWGLFTLQAEPLPPKHNQLCRWDTGTLLCLQPHKWLHTWRPLCLIKSFSSTPGKKPSNIRHPCHPNCCMC